MTAGCNPTPRPNGNIHEISETLGAYGIRLDHIEADVNEMKLTLNKILAAMQQITGARKALVILLTFVTVCAGSIGAGISYAVSLFK